MSYQNPETVSHGFSSDTQQLTNGNCYNVLETTIKNSNEIQLDKAVTFQDVQNVFGLSVNSALNFGVFSAGSSANYLRQMEEKDYSLSLNYYSLPAAIIEVSPVGYGLKFLNQQGVENYNNGSNPYFGLVCGDQYVTSYQLGALLALGINIDLESSYQKQQFIAASGGSFGDLFSASLAIQQTSQSLSLNGQISMHAYQIGGESQYLAYIFGSNSTGGYYAFDCSLQNMNSCIKAAESLLDYAKFNFTHQINFNPVNNLEYVNLLSLEPVAYQGIQTPPSLVTSEVIEARKNLSEALFENQYYSQKITELYATYPTVNVDQSTQVQFSYDFNSKLQDLWNNIKSNIDVLTSTDDPETSAIQCYNQPSICPEIATNLLSNITPITAQNLTFLDAIKYYYSSPIDVCGGYGGNVLFYNTGDQWGYLNGVQVDQIYNLQSCILNGTSSSVVFDTSSTIDGDRFQWVMDNAVELANGDIQFNYVSSEGATAACHPTIFHQYEFQVQIEPYHSDLL